MILLMFYLCSPVALRAFLEQVFEIFVGQLMYLHFFRESCWKFTMFLWWSHDSLIV